MIQANDWHSTFTLYGTDSQFQQRDRKPDTNSGAPPTVTPDTTPPANEESSSSSSNEVTYESYL